MLSNLLEKIKSFDSLDLVLPKDPISKNRSVTLLFALVSFVCLIVASSLQAAGKINNTSDFKEVFYASLATYLGRRFQSANKAEVSDAAK